VSFTKQQDACCVGLFTSDQRWLERELMWTLCSLLWARFQVIWPANLLGVRESDYEGYAGNHGHLAPVCRECVSVIGA